MSMSFSERYGFASPREDLQRRDMDKALRIGLWNAFLELHAELRRLSHAQQKQSWRVLGTELWTDFLKGALDQLDDEALFAELRALHVHGVWCQVYDAVQFIAERCPARKYREFFARYVESCNRILEREKSAWRFVGNQLEPITSGAEIVAIERAAKSPWETARAHVGKALARFGDRKSPDYANAAKEAITAVEAAAQAITGETDKTLGQLIPSLPLHDALKGTLRQFWGYANRASGIRHPEKEGEVPPTQADAHLMIVVCSGFLNYLAQQVEED